MTSRFAAAGVDQPVGGSQTYASTLVKFRTKHRVYADGHFIIPNFKLAAGFIETAIGGASRSLQLSAQIGSGTVVDITFSGNASKTIDPTVMSIIAHDDITAAMFGLSWPQDVFLIQEYTITSGNALPLTVAAASGVTGEGTVFGGSTQVHLGGALVGGTSSSTQSRPIAYISSSYTGVATAGIGDSVTFGAIGTGYDVGNGESGGGWFARACYSAAVPYYKMAQNGAFTNWITVANCPLTLSLMQYATHAMLQFGLNDHVAAGNQTPTFIVESRTLRRLLRSYNTNLYITQGLVTPITTSTDGWVTVVNQTPSTGWTNTDAEIPGSNTFIAGDVGRNNLDATYSLRTSMCDAVVTDKWVAGMTLDGVHPGLAADHATIAAGITATIAAFAVPISTKFGSYHLDMTNIDGATYLSRGADLTGAVDGKLGSLSCWVNFAAAGNGVAQVIFAQTTGSFVLFKTATNKIYVIVFSSVGEGAIHFEFQTVNSYVGANGLLHILASWDTNHAAGLKVGQLYINDVSDMAVVTDTGAAFNVDLTTGDFRVGAYPDATLKLNANLGDLWIDTTAAMDFSVTANRRKFISATGKPVDLGDRGELPTATRPILFMKAPAQAFKYDLGSDAGVFTVTGTLTDVSNNAPAITSNGGGATAAINAAENQTAVTTVTATDADAVDALTFSISGGADAAKFAINASTGVLTFVTAPDFEIPTDANTDNDYVVIVQVSDGVLTDTQTITVTVTDVTTEARRGGGGSALAVAMALTAKKKSRGPYWPDWLR